MLVSIRDRHGSALPKPTPPDVKQQERRTSTKGSYPLVKFSKFIFRCSFNRFFWEFLRWIQGRKSNNLMTPTWKPRAFNSAPGLIETGSKITESKRKILFVVSAPCGPILEILNLEKMQHAMQKISKMDPKNANKKQLQKENAKKRKS